MRSTSESVGDCVKSQEVKEEGGDVGRHVWAFLYWGFGAVEVISKIFTATCSLHSIYSEAKALLVI